MNTDFISENPEIPSQDWVQERKNYIGGSDVAAILGQSSFKTPLQVWMLKQGLVEPTKSTSIMDFGNIFEPIMADYFQEMTSLKTRRVNKPFIHEEHEFLRANIDRQILNGQGVDGTGVLELKTTNSHRLKSLGNQYPVEWGFQLQHYLGLTRYSYGYLLIYERDTCEFYEPIFVERNEKLISENTARLIEWWKTHMISGKRPKAQNGEDLLTLYPNSSDGKVIEVTPRDYGIYQKLKQVRKDKTELKEIETELKNKLKASLGDAERLVCRGNTLVSWESHSRRSLDSTRLHEEKPEVYADFLTETSYRRFSVK